MKKSLGFTTLALALSVFTMQSSQAAFKQNNYVCEELHMEDSFGCADKAVATEKKRLNQTYKKIHNRLSTAQKKQLDNEQLAWLKKRNAKCDNSDDSAPMNNMVVYQMIADNLCTANETQNRTKFLMNKYKVK